MYSPAFSEAWMALEVEEKKMLIKQATSGLVPSEITKAASRLKSLILKEKRGTA